MAELGSEGFSDFADELEDFKEDLQEVRAGLDDALTLAVATTAQRLGAEMEDNIIQHDAVDTGELLDSIAVDPTQDDYQWKVGPTADHARYVEYGTGSHDITPDGLTVSDVEEMSYRELEASDIDPLVFWADGEKVETYHVDHPGTDPQPFFNPAVTTAETEGWLEGNIEDALEARFTEATE